MRVQLGDDNRAITDFDFVIKMEPKNFMAIFNRALLHDKTGNLKAAIRDYTTVINQFPNFWTGLSARASRYPASLECEDQEGDAQAFGDRPKQVRFHCGG